MSKRIGMLVVIVATAVVTLAAAAPASAVNFEPAAGTYTVDTTALTLTGPGTNVTGTDQGGVAVFSFDNVSIPASVEIEVEGSRPFKLVAAGDLALAGLIEGSGFSATDFVPGPLAGGPGGGAGGADTGLPGQGPGAGGGASNISSGGGGGGFGGAGAAGGSSGGTGGAGGSAYGDLNALLQGGSGGGGGNGVGAGGGGGALALFGSSVRIVGSGEVVVDGGGGAVGGFGASGGGSGGGIVIHGNSVQMDGLLSAAGGPGGAGGCCGAGGGGGGGRIAFQYKTLSVTGSTDVSGGTSGVRSTSGSFPPGVLGDPAGAPGVVTKVQIPEVAITPTPTVSSSAAKPCVVPRLKGKKVLAARKALKKAQCSIGKVKKSFSRKVKKGRVIRQKTRPGKVLPAGAKVGLTVSKGKK